MSSFIELESLDYQALRKLAKSKNIRQSGKGVTKKKLVSLLWSSFRESSIPESLDSSQSSRMESSDQLPLQEVPLESILPILSPKDETFGKKKNFNIEVDLNDSNKENSLYRRLTFDIAQSQSLIKGGKPEAPPAINNKISPSACKVVKRVTIAKTPTNVKPEDFSTPKPHMKIVKTPAAVRSSSLRPSATSHHFKTPVKRVSQSHVKTPGITRTVSLRLASSAKKKEKSKGQSKIPKINANKLPNFASIHQNAFEKMDSLLDVEHQRVLRKRQIESVKAFTAKMGIDPVSTKKRPQPKKAVVKKIEPMKSTLAKKAPAKRSPAKKSLAKKSPAKKSPAKKSPAKKSPAKKSPAKKSPAKKSPAKKSPAKKSPAKRSPVTKAPSKISPTKKTLTKINPAKIASAKAVSSSSIPVKVIHVFNATNIPQKESPVKKMNMKEVACHAVNKVKPLKLTGARDQNRTFLKGVRINRRFEMQMKNRGLM